MTNPAAPPATLTPEEISRILNSSLAALESARDTIEDALTTAVQAEVMVRRLGLRQATYLVENDSDALPDAGRHQSESNEAFRQIREKLVECRTSIAVMKRRIVSLDAQLQSVSTVYAPDS